MLVVGLTGGIASGKSTVSHLLAEHQIPIIDADVLSRRVVEPGTAGLRKIVREFGPTVQQADGSLDRKRLGQIVFRDKEKRRKLERIIHPAVRRAMLWDVCRCWMKGDRVCVIDTPLLIEAGLWKWVGRIVVVYCSKELQLRRLIERDHMSEEDARSRLSAQLPLSEKLDYADYVLDNSGTIPELQRQVTSLVRTLDNQSSYITYKLSWFFPPYGLLSAALTLWWRAMKRRSKSQRRRRGPKKSEIEIVEMKVRAGSGEPEES